MTSGCLDRKEVRGAIWGVHSTGDRPAGGDTGRLFLTFGGPVCADRISNCPLDRVLTYKNLIYLLNLQIFLLALCVLRSLSYCYFILWVLWHHLVRLEDSADILWQLLTHILFVHAAVTRKRVRIPVLRTSHVLTVNYSRKIRNCNLPTQYTKRRKRRRI